MQMRLLNLDRSTDRLALFHARNGYRPGLRRVAAVDGRLADRARLAANDVLAPGLPYTDGALGCVLSHLTQWRDSVAEDQAITVVEDDAVLCAGFETEVARALATLPDDWEYVMWGYNFDAPLTFELGDGLSSCTALLDQDALRRNLPRFAAAPVRTALHRLHRGFGTVAYSISPRGARRLLGFCLPLRPMSTLHPSLPHPVPNTGIDNMLAHLWPSMAAFVAMPPLAVTANDPVASTVQGMAAAAAADGMSAGTLLALAGEAGLDGAVAIGIRATAHSTLATAALRRLGWSGFDIAAPPGQLAAALRERAVRRGFDLLHVGPACAPHEVVAALLAEFRPRLVVLPPDTCTLATSLAGPGDAPSYAGLAAALGYAVGACSPAHTVLRRVSEVGPKSDNSCSDPEAVRLWH